MQDGAPGGLSIGVIVPDLSRSGGAERLAIQCIRRWQDRHRITLYSQAFGKRWLSEVGLSDDVRRRRISSSFGPGSPVPLATTRLLEGLLLPSLWSREIGDHDVYLGHQWPTHRLERRPLVWYAHEAHRPSYDLLRNRHDRGLDAEGWTFLESTRGTAAHGDDRYEILHDAIRALDGDAAPDRIVANSQLTRAALRDSLGPRAIDVVYPGVDPTLMPEPEPDDDDPYFLCVGSMTPHKRHRLAIEALSLMEGARLVIVGTGPFARYVERGAARLGVADRVEVRREVRDAELRRLYAGCRAVVFTPLNEPFGMVALEALAAGKPLIGVDEGGFTEVVDSSCALLTRDEPAALAEAMGALLARPDDARRMGEAGRKVAQQLTWDRTARELEAILIETHRAAAAAPAAPRPRDLGRGGGPAVGVRVRADYGDGFAEGAWRQLRAPADMPRLGYYALHHEHVLRRQLAEIERCGFEFVTLALPLDDRRLSPQGAAALRHALATAPTLGGAARFAVELVLDGPPPALLRGALDWLAGVLRDREAVVRHDDRPLVLLRGPAPGGSAGHPELCVMATPEPGASGPVALVPASDGSGLGEALARARAARPAPELLIVSSWNDHLAGDALEPTVGTGDARVEAARAALAAR